MSCNIQDIQSNLQSLENQINAAELSEQVIPKVLEILEEYGREIEALHGTQDVQETWKRVYSYCINVEINELDKRIQSLSPNSSPQEVRQLLQLHASLSGRGHLSESQQRFLNDLQEVFKQISETFEFGTLSLLPEELMANIVSLLSVEDLCRLARLSKEFKSFSSDEMFWKPLASDVVLKKWIHNLKNGFFTSKTILDTLFVSKMRVANGRLFVKKDNNIMAWDLKTMQRLDKGSIWNFHFSFQVAENHLFFRGLNRSSIEIWDLETMLYSFGNNEFCTCMNIVGDLLFVGLGDGSVKIWNWKTKELLKTVSTNIVFGVIECLQVKGDLLFLSNHDQIHVMNWKTQQPFTKLREDLFPFPIDLFQVVDDLVVSSVGKYGIMYVWDLKKNQCIASTQDTNDYICCFEIVGDLVFSGLRDGSVKVRDLKTMKCLATIKVNQGFIHCLQFVDGRLLCGSASHSGVKIFDFNATPAEALTEIAAELKKGNPDSAHFAMLPKNMQNLIFGELYKIASFEHDYWGCAEDAFWERNGLSTTNEKRMQAIQNYLVGYIMQLLKENKTDEAVQEFEHLPKEIQQTVLAQNMTDEQRNQLEAKYQAN